MLSQIAVLLSLMVVVSWQIDCRGRSICDVDITVPASEYPGLIWIDPGTSIRFTNRVTKNMAEHTVTPLKTSNAVNYFGGLSFYATDLGGLYTQTQVICGDVNCMDAFAVKRDPTSPFLTKNWPIADYPYYCQFHGGPEKGIIRVGNGAGIEPPLPPNTDPDTVKKGCCANPTLCAMMKPAGCSDEWTVASQTGLGYCEPSDTLGCTAGGDGICRWAPPGIENCMIQGKKCLNGLCVELDVVAPSPPSGSPCGGPCTSFPAPSCLDSTTLRYMADATKAVCGNVAGAFACQYPQLRLDCSTFGAGTTCSNGQCVQNGASRFTPPPLTGGNPSSPSPPQTNGPAVPTPPGQQACSTSNCPSPKQCINNACQQCTADCASLAGVCGCGVECGCTSASCKACPVSATGSPTPDPTRPCSTAAPQGFCAAGQRCSLVGNAYGCMLIPPCSQAEREKQCAVAGQVCQGNNGVYTCGQPTPTCSASAATGRCEAAGTRCMNTGGVYVCAAPGIAAQPCSLLNPQGACAQGLTCNTSPIGQVSCGMPPMPATGTSSCSVTADVCTAACKKSAVASCSCAGVQCQAIDTPKDAASSTAVSFATMWIALLVAICVCGE